MLKIKWYTKAAAFIAGCFFLCSCENDLGEVQKINTKELGKDVAKDIKIRYSVAGKKKAILTAPLMYKVQDTASYIEFPNTLHVDFYNEKGDSIESRLDAKYAKYRESKSVVYLRDSVRVINVMGDTLYCKQLNWDRNRTGQEFYTNDTVRIRRKMQVIDGIGMDARQDFKEWHIVKPVGFVKVPGNEFPE
ncbi:MAG TPA: LPS export ABC transporter periplasmic protein LptC [Ferruginibacter sp.]|jgi:LPS export ABC transporter protein LptC|nr:LPS export ABC transporter periplasmic protein LptC [Ferruginibacter sp.]HPH93241.1 LPS export ABC transporter periplasmic protein LptC [Ferruginibacter sp.]